MSEAKPTPGPWTVLPEESDKDYLRIRGTCLGGRYKIANVHMPRHWESHDVLRDRENAESQANARLIADAGTVFHTTGLTPSQLVERVKELEEALHCYMDAIHYAQDKKALMAAIKAADDKARAALSKARPNTAEGETEAEATDGTRWNQTPCEHCGYTEGEHFNARCLHITDETRYTPAAAKEPSP